MCIAGVLSVDNDQTKKLRGINTDGCPDAVGSLLLLPAVAVADDVVVAAVDVNDIAPLAHRIQTSSTNTDQYNALSILCRYNNNSSNNNIINNNNNNNNNNQLHQ